jgi:nitrite reductase/ring-hydroxylating ferredoxin subunit
VCLLTTSTSTTEDPTTSTTTMSTSTTTTMQLTCEVATQKIVLLQAEIVALDAVCPHWSVSGTNCAADTVDG